jgi:hypothetical protein
MKSGSEDLCRLLDLHRWRLVPQVIVMTDWAGVLAAWCGCFGELFTSATADQASQSPTKGTLLLRICIPEGSDEDVMCRMMRGAQNVRLLHERSLFLTACLLCQDTVTVFNA